MPLWCCAALAVSMERIEVPAGPFFMGCSLGDSRCEADEGPAGGIEVSVPGFRIDAHEVTVAAYRACMAAGACARPKDHARNKYCNLDAPDREDHPINCLDWDQAAAYCAWRGGRLPREAEWEKAARGGSRTAYPHGVEIDCADAVLDDGKTLGSAGNEPDGCGEDRTWPVGSRPPNALGLYDMQGNAGEWTASWYTPDAIVALYAAGDLDGPAEGRRRVVRGGSWDENVANLRSSYRNVKPPVSGGAVYGSIGFRCAGP